MDFPELRGELRSLDAAVLALRKCEHRLSLVLGWIIRHHGSLPEDLAEELKDTELDGGDGNPTSVEISLSVNTEIKGESDEFGGPYSPIQPDAYLESSLNTPTPEELVRTETDSPIRIVDIRTIVAPSTSNPANNLDYRCLYCVSYFSSASELIQHSRIHHKSEIKFLAKGKKGHAALQRNQLKNIKTKNLPSQLKNARTPKQATKLREVDKPPEIQHNVRKSTRIAKRIETVLAGSPRKVRKVSTKRKSEKLCQQPITVKTEPSPEEVPGITRNTGLIPISQISEQRMNIPKIQINPDRPKNERKSQQVSRNSKWECGQCPMSFDSNNALIDHVEEAHPHGEAAFPCRNRGCTDSFSIALDLKHHIEAAHAEDDTRKVTCHPCGLPFRNRAILYRHERSVHADTTCKTCGECFKTVRSLRFHEGKVHDLRPSTVCDICGNEYRSAVALKMHMAQVHVEKTFLCSACGVALKTKNHLRVHFQRCHNPPPRSQDRPLKCRYCDSTFRQKHILKNHEDRHTGKKMRQCPYCEVVKHCTDLSNHIIIVHRGRKYKCNHCTSMFSLRAHFRNHFVLKHPDVDVAMEAAFTLIYTGDVDNIANPEDTEQPAPPSPTKKGPRPSSSRKSVHKSDLSCSTCDETLSSKDEFDLHMLRHEKDPHYRLKHRFPVQRVNPEAVSKN